MSKEKSHLITTSLIRDVQWAMNAPDSIIKEEKGGDGKTTWKEKALEDLEHSVGRVKTPFPEAAKRGVDFERMVYNKANEIDPGGSDFFKQVCKEVRGFQYYQKKGINEQIGEYDCYLYGKFDAIKFSDEPYIKDLKTTAKYKRGSYLKGFQHKLYCYITKINNFDYVVAEWDKHPKIKSVNIEKYEVEDWDLLKDTIHSEVLECFDILKSLDLWDLYREKFCLY